MKRVITDHTMTYFGFNVNSLVNSTPALPTCKDERVMLVDSDNNERGQRLRSLTAPHPFWIRASYVFVDVFQEMHNEQKFLVQERSMNKDYAPGCFILSTGGVFSPGEGKLENALRELEEETGLTVYDDCD